MAIQKIKYNLYCLFFINIFLTITANCQPVERKTLILYIDTISFFKDKKVISGSIKNISSNTIFFELGIEEFFENHWYDIIGDLNYPNGDSFAIDHIKSNSIKYFKFKPETMPNPLHRIRRLRFFIKYGTDYHFLNSRYFFKEFPF